MLLGVVFIFVGFLIFLFSFILIVIDDYNYRVEWNDLFNRFVYRKVPAPESNRAWVFIILSVILIYLGYMLEGLSYVNFD